MQKKEDIRTITIEMSPLNVARLCRCFDEFRDPNDTIESFAYRVMRRGLDYFEDLYEEGRTQ